MFTNRVKNRGIKPSAQALRMLRSKRRDDSVRFRSGHTSFVRLDLPDLTYHLNQMDPTRIEYEQVGKPNGPNPKPALGGFTKDQPSVSLIDILPQFMALSAAQNAMQETTITEMWMHLAAGFMAHAVIEQCLDYGNESRELLQEAFAWGFDAECGAEEGSNEWQVNAMFWGEEGVVIGWERIRDEHMHFVSFETSSLTVFSDATSSACPTTRIESSRTFPNAGWG